MERSNHPISHEVGARLLLQVPELADPAEWGVDDSCDASTGMTPWHKSGKM